MSIPLPSRRGTSGLVTLALLAGCASTSPMSSGLGATSMGRGPPGHYAQTVDSATNGCLRNPACYTQTGDDAVLPWLSRSMEAARTITTVMRLLDAAEIGRIEEILTSCANDAHHQVNADDEELKGQSPTREQCKQVIRMEGRTEITRAMDLGRRKHDLALACARRELAKFFPDNVSVEPRYQQDPSTGKWQWLDPQTVAEWLRDGLSSRLKGSLVPDIVIHASGDPNKVQRVYDFKFPCPSDNRPTWGKYPPSHPHYPNTQGDMYKEALLHGQREPGRVTPLGVQ